MKNNFQRCLNLNLEDERVLEAKLSRYIYRLIIMCVPIATIVATTCFVNRTLNFALMIANHTTPTSAA